MIYYINGLKSNQLNMYDNNHLSDFDILAGMLNNTRPPIPTDNIQQYKTTHAPYIIAGALSEPIRKNENMISRSLLFLDLDDIEANETDFINAISNKLYKRRFIAYPTISHNIKGTRYRLILDIDRPIMTAREYSGLIELLTRELYENVLNQEKYSLDISNQTWAQLQGWHVTTEANKNSPILIHTEGKAIEVDKIIKHITDQPQNVPHSVSERYQYNSAGKPREWTEVMRTLISGEIYEGERHQFYLKAFRAVLFGCGNDIDKLDYYIDLINEFNSSRCYPPYTPEELQKDFSEAMRFVLQRNK